MFASIRRLGLRFLFPAIWREFRFQHGASSIDKTSDKFYKNYFVKNKTAKTNVNKHVTADNCNQKKMLANFNGSFESVDNRVTKQRSSSFLQKTDQKQRLVGIGLEKLY